MILRRPSQTDKEAILEMMAEFEREQSAHDGGFWNPDNFVYEEWLEENLQAEAGLNIPENWVPAIQLVSFDEAGQALGFLNLRLRLNDYLLEKGGHIGYSIRPSERGKGYAKESLRQGLQIAKKRIFIVFWSLVVSRILLAKLLSWPTVVSWRTFAMKLSAIG